MRALSIVLFIPLFFFVGAGTALTASGLSLVTFLFWVIAGIITFAACLINAHKTRGGKFSAAFQMLGWGTLFLAASAIIQTFFNERLGQGTAQLMHDAGFVIGFILVLAASNRFLKAMTG